MRGAFIIAEPGCTHQGNLEVMHQLIDMAADCGAHAYKATWMPDVEVVLQRRNMQPGTDDYLTYHRVYRWHAWPIGWHVPLRQHCHDRGLKYYCTVHSMEGVRRLADFVDGFKIASFEAQDRELVRAASVARPTYVSTGMMEGPYHRVRTEQTLHCTSGYPTPLSELNLRAIRERGHAGFSDHSSPAGTITGALAVAAGAQVIEAHIRPTPTPADNPDRAVAMDRGNFQDYCFLIREADRAMGVGAPGLQPSEAPMLKYRVQGDPHA